MIYSANREIHLHHLKLVFEVLRRHHYVVNKKKCVLGARRIKYLGHFISVEGVSTDPKKVEAFVNWPEPQNVKQLRSFLGMAGYYRRFIKGYSVIAQPLTELLKKGNGFLWKTETKEAFHKLKEALCSAPVLALPDLSLPFVVEADACQTGIGAVLMQCLHPVAYISRTLSLKNQALSVYDKELLALVFAVEKWHSYLIIQPFIIKTDQKSLRYLLEQKLTTPSQFGWLAKYIIQYKQGKEILVADALSRTTHGELLQISISNVSSELWEYGIAFLWIS